MNSHTQTHAPNNADNTQSVIHDASSKSTPADADTVGIIDSDASNVVKKLSWANIKATLKTYFDTIYEAAIGAKGTAFNKNFGSNAGDVSEGNHGHAALDFNSGGARVKGATGSNYVAITAVEQTANRELKIPALDSNDELVTVFGVQRISGSKIFDGGSIKILDTQELYSINLDLNHSLAANRVLNIPLLESDDEIMTLGTDQEVVETKRFAHEKFVIQDSQGENLKVSADNQGDPAKIIISDLGGVDHTLVFAALPQTLKNKTINAAENTIIGVTADQKIVFGTAISTTPNTIEVADHKFKTTDVNRHEAVSLLLRKNLFVKGEWFVLVQTGDGQFTLNGEDPGVTVPAWKKSAGKGFEMYVYCVDDTEDANVFRIVGGVE